LTKIILKILVLIGIILEFEFLTNQRLLVDVYYSPNFWALGGILIVFGSFPLLVLYKPKPSFPIEHPFYVNILKYILPTLLALFVFRYFITTFNTFPVDPMNSDVIPTLKILCQRVLNKEWVYAPIHFPTWTVNNAYLPLQYLPLLPAELLHLDYRVYAFWFFIATLLFITYKTKKSGSSTVEIVLKSFFALYILYIWNETEKGTFAFSIELLDVSFYLILALSFFIKDWRFRSVAILLCLLSRYAFLLWLPMYAVIYWMENGKKEALKILIAVFIGVCVLYVIPFLTVKPNLYFEGLKYYDLTAQSGWSHNVNDGKYPNKPDIIQRGFSWSIYIWDAVKGDYLEKLRVAKKLHIGTSLLASLLGYFVYLILRRRKLKNGKYFNFDGLTLVSLKFYFIFFYGFMYVPFPYLYLLPMFFSIAILYRIEFFKS
jgi:hypothetical protein